MARFSSANSRAFSQSSNPRSAEIALARRFQANGELSIQNSPICVWSSVRSLGVVVTSPPSRLISL